MPVNDEMLDRMTLNDIVKGIILLKKGGQNFLVEELRDGIGNAVDLYDRLRIVNNQFLDNLFFFYEGYLHGEWDLPHYRLSKEGRDVIEKDLINFCKEAVLVNKTEICKYSVEL